MIYDHNQWIGNVLTDAGEQVYKNWRKKIESLTYLFESDLRKLNKDFNLNFTPRDGHHPYLLTLYLSGDVSLETMVILDSILMYRKDWDKQITEKYVWPSVSLKIRKYAPFLHFDRKKMTRKALEVIA
jgi:hypothetical protein